MSSWSPGFSRSAGPSPESATLVGSSSPTFSSLPATSSYRRRSTSYGSNVLNAGPRYRQNVSPSTEDAAAVATHDAPRTEEFNLLQRAWGSYPSSARPRTRREELQMLPALCNDSESFERQTAYLHETVEVPGLLSQTRALFRLHEEPERRIRWEDAGRMPTQGVSRFRDEYADRDGECVGESSRMARSYDSYDRGINNYVRGANLHDLQTDEYVERGDGRIMGLGESSRGTDQRVGNADSVHAFMQEDVSQSAQGQGSQEFEMGATQRGWRNRDYRYEGQTSSRRAGSFSRGD